MLNITLLGCGGTMPTAQRHLTSCVVGFNGTTILIDCGEGTQLALREKSISLKKIDTIFLTHVHIDHTAGLVGLLSTMSNEDRRELVTIYGPSGTVAHVQNILNMCNLRFAVTLVDLDEGSVFELNKLKITVFNAKHSVPCYGYCFEVNRAPKVLLEKAEENNIPLDLISELQEKKAMYYQDRLITISDITGPARKGLKFVYCTDTRPSYEIVDAAKNADLLILEAMYMSDSASRLAVRKKHLLASEAISLIESANVKEAWLTHFSPAVPYPAKELDLSKYKNISFGYDGREIDLQYGED